jgi:uncharacterized protein YukE
MPPLRVDYFGLEAIASELKRNAEARFSDINSLSNRVNPANVWEGNIPDLYLKKYEQWRQAQAYLVTALEELSDVFMLIIDELPCDCDHRGGAALM